MIERAIATNMPFTWVAADDAKQAWLTSSTASALGPHLVNGRVRINPLVPGAGAAFQF